MSLMIRTFQVFLGLMFVIMFIRFYMVGDLKAGVVAIIASQLFLLFEMHEKQKEFFEEVDRRKLLKEMEEKEDG